MFLHLKFVMFFWDNLIYRNVILSPHNVIIILNNKLYRITEVVPPSSISLISAKKYIKVVSHTGNFFLFMIHSQSEKGCIHIHGLHDRPLHIVETSG
jgi:hypothetical protein